LKTLAFIFRGRGQCAFNSNSEFSVGKEPANKLDDANRKMEFEKFI